jgi:Uma2 family endonuclease
MICPGGRTGGILDVAKARDEGGLVMSTMVAIQPSVAGISEAPFRTEVRREVTPEELLAMPDGGHYELIDGELRERNVGALSNLVTIRVSTMLENHCRPHDLGWLFSSEQGYQCFPEKPRRVRRADVSFIRRERYSLEEIESIGFMTIAPDLAVEVVSRNDLASEDVEEKVDEYILAGVRLVWVVYPVTRTVYVIRGDGTGYRLRSGDELTGEDVIPGFRCRVADLFPASPVAETVVSGQAAAGPEGS